MDRFGKSRLVKLMDDVSLIAKIKSKKPCYLKAGLAINDDNAYAITRKKIAVATIPINA